MIRFERPAVLTKFVFVLLCAAGTVALGGERALAQGMPLDPSSIVAGDYAGWIVPAQNIAKTIYMALIVFDLIALAITTLLFRENVGEFVSSLSLKVLMGGVFFFLIANGPGLTSAVIQYFKSSSTSFGGNPDTGVLTVVVGFLTAAALYFTASYTATVEGSALALLTGGSGLGFGDVGAPLSALISPESFILVTQGLGLMVTLGAFAILLQYSIVTIESYLVMSVGTLMIGFAGSRFTFSFSQGYFSYMINVGVKLLVTYIILGVVSLTLVPIILTAAATALLASGIPFVGALVSMAVAVLSACYVVLAAGLIWTIPAFTASLLTGQSQSSGAALLQQAAASFAGAAQMFGQFGAANRALADARETTAAQGQSQGAGALGPGSQNMSPAPAPDGFAAQGAQPGTTGGAPLNGSTGQPFGAGAYGSGGNDQRTPQQRAEDDRAQAKLDMAYGLSGLAQAAPRDIGQPTAVQVRTSNPDKL